MKFLEKDLEQIVFEAEPSMIHERGLSCYSRFHKKFRQLNLGKYGIADIVTLRFCKDHTIDVTVYELKQEAVNAGTLLQAKGYCKGIDQLFRSLGIFDHYLVFSIVLVGSKIDTNSNFCYIPEYLGQVSLYTYSYELDGLYFQEKSGYSLKESGFTLPVQAEFSEMLSEFEEIMEQEPDGYIPTAALSETDKEDLPF